MSNEANRVGEQFGDYRLLRVLGTGGFGQVYLGEHRHDGTHAAIKVLYTQLTGSEELKAFLNEARTFRLQHPNIVRLLDFGVGPGDTPYLAMEYAPYGTLRTRHAKGTRVPLEDICTYIIPIANALQYAHERHLVHRDVKPENMLIGPQQQIWLSDFGIMTTAHSTHSMQAASVVGTWAYIAPEQISGKPQPASDQYALGIVVYEWLCGKRPFTGSIGEIFVQHMQKVPDPLRTHMPELSADIEAVVQTALEKDPHNRFATIQDFANAFQQACRRPADLPLELSTQRDKTNAVEQPEESPASTNPSFSQETFSPQTQESVHTSQKIFPRRALLGGFTGLIIAGTGISYLLYTTYNKLANVPAQQKAAPTQQPMATPIPTSPPPAHQTIVDPVDNWSKVYSHTDHLGFDRTNVANIGEDSARIFRRDKSMLNEEVVWKLSDMASFSALAYFWLGEAISHFSIYTSTDGSNWTQGSPDIVILQAGNFKKGTWRVYQYILNDLPHVNYVKVRWNNTSGKSWSPQIGKATLQS